MPKDPAERAAEHGRDGGDERVPPYALRLCKAHRHEQHFGRDDEDRALDERDERKPPFGAFARRKRDRPVVEFSQHGGCSGMIPKSGNRFSEKTMPKQKLDMTWSCLATHTRKVH